MPPSAATTTTIATDTTPPTAPFPNARTLAHVSPTTTGASPAPIRSRHGKRDRSPKEKVEHEAAECARFEELSAEMDALYDGAGAPPEAS